MNERRLLETVVEALEHGHHGSHHEWRGNEYVADGESRQGALPVDAGGIAEDVEKLQEGDSRDDGRNLQRITRNAGDNKGPAWGPFPR